ADVGRAVRIVARGTLHLAFPYRHVAHTLLLGHFGRVTCLAGVHDADRLQLRLLRFWIVDRVAGDARQVTGVVHAALPLRVVAAAVAGQAGLRHVARLHG